MNHTALVEQYQRLRAELLGAHPDLDAATLADTLEGATEITETVSRYIRDAIEDETLAKALGDRLDEMGERRSRFADRAARRRAIAQALMASVGMDKLQQPDFTAGIRNVPPKVVETDPALIPDKFWKITRSLDKVALKDALTSGDAVPGASLSNGSQTLSIRTR